MALLLTLTYSKAKGYENYHYQIKEPTLSFFDLYRFSNNFWTSIAFSYGKIKIDNIRRTIPIYKGKVTEHSDTKGNNAHFNLKMGYFYPINEQLNLNTFLGITHNNITIKAFEEKNNLSTSMSFEKIKFKQTYATLGLNLSYHVDDIQYFGAIALSHQLKDNNYNIKSILKKFPKKFKRQIKLFDNNWIDVDVGAQKAMTDKSLIRASIGLNHGLSSKNQYRLNLGWQYKFK